MATIKVEYQLPTVMPHGWKMGVAKALGVHRNTVKNNLNEGKGDMYDRIMQCAKEKYGKPIKTTTV